MAFKFGDRVKETSTTTGTGSLTLSGAVSKYIAFSDALATDDFCYYVIEHQSAAEWEVGFGKLTASTTLARTSVIASSNSGAAVDLAAGTKHVFIAPIAHAAAASLLSTFGDGSSGDLTASSGTTTLTADAFYKNVTLTGTARINTAAYRLYVSEVLDVSGAGTGAIYNDGTAGGASPGTTAGASANGVTATTTGASGGSTGGATGATGNGNQATAPTNQNHANGGGGGASGAGGSGNGGATTGGASRSGANVATPLVIRSVKHDLIKMTSATGIQLLIGGAGGAGGGSGGGDGGSSGGGGGGGSGGGVLFVFARFINRGGSTGAGCFSALGGAGGNGGTNGANRGGGGGGSGGGGGWIYMAYQTLLGSTATDACKATGGAGGTGGNGGGTGNGGNGGGGGSGGRITLINLGTGNITVVAPGTAGDAGSAGSGTTGGAGGAGGASTASL